MNNNYKLGKVEAIFAICVVMVNRIILNLPYSILESTGTGSILNLIYIGAIGLLFVIIINKLLKVFPNSDIIDLAEFSRWKIISNYYRNIFYCIIIFNIIFNYHRFYKFT